MYRLVGDGSGVEAVRLGVPMVFRGSLVALTLASDTAITGGSVKVQVFLNGTGSGTLMWTSGSTATATFEPNKHGFMVGNELSIRITPQSFTPAATANIEVIAYLTQASSA